MKLKIQKGKFIRNIIIGVIALIIVAFIINTAPGYKRNECYKSSNWGRECYREASKANLLR